MAITRFHPPFYSGTRVHIPMDKSGKGTFVLFRDHDEKVKRLEARIEELERMLATEITGTVIDLEARISKTINDVLYGE